MHVWRISRERYATSAFSGSGSKQNAGRWHEVGTPVVYTSDSIALACVEVFVNLDLQVSMPKMVSIRASIPDEILTESVLEEQLPADWRAVPSIPCRALGSAWFQRASSAVLRVPSAAVMGAFNFLLNPEHPDFSRIVLERAQPFRFDPRMFRRA